MKNYPDNQRWEPEFNLPASSGPSGRNMKMSYCEMMQKNKPQSNSYAGGILILAAGGYHVAWLLWNIAFYNPYYGSLMLSAALIWFPVICSWYIGTILGNVFGATLLTSWQKKHIYYLSGAFSTLSSILFIVWYNVIPAIVVGRLFAGMAYGMAYVTSITHGSENCVKEMRGRLISSINFILYSTIFTTTIVMIYTYNAYSEFPLERMIGIFALIFSLVGLAFTPFLTYESVTYLLYRNDERKALENMIKLRNESVMTWNIKNDLEEMKLMVAQDRLQNRNIFGDSNGRSLRMMLAISVIVAVSSNLILNNSLIAITGKAFDIGYALAAIVLVGCRYFAGSVMMLFGDSVGRKKLLVISAGSSAACLFVVRILSTFVGSYPSGSLIHLPGGILAIAFQIFVGIGVEPIQHVLLSEAFSTAKKYWSIAFVASIESLIQIVIIVIYFVNGSILLSVFVYVSTGCIVLMTIFLQMQLPETRGMSLKQARDEFTKTGRPEGITYS